jgi:hypothetical protein
METKRFVIPLALFILLGMFASVSFGCLNFPQDRNTGNYIKDERTVGNFSKLEIGGAFKVFLSQGDQHKLVIEANADDMNAVVTEVVGGKLKIYNKPGWRSMFQDMTIYLTFTDLDYIDFSGAVEVISEGHLIFSDLRMNVSGAAEIEMKMKVEKFDAEFSGASEINFSGTCNTGFLELSGASDFDAEGLEFQDLSIEVSGASDARVWASGTLYIDASGASDIRYKGSPKISIDQSGASSVKPI